MLCVRHPTAVNPRDHRPALVPHLLGYPYWVLAGRQHHAGVRVSRLVRIPAAHTTSLQRLGPQPIADGLVTSQAELASALSATVASPPLRR